MQSHLMNKRRSEVSVAPLRPLALNRATEILPYRGTLFLKVIKGTQLVQAPKPPPQRESKLGARLSAFLGDGRVEAGPVMMHAVSVTSWLTDAEAEARGEGGGGGSGGGGDSPGVARSITGEPNTGSFSASSGEEGFGRASSESSLSAAAAGAAARGGGPQGTGALRSGGAEGRGGVVRRTPKPDAARTSSKFVSHGDADGGASWDEEFFFGRVSGEVAVRIVCIDKPLREGAEDEVVGELLIPVSRLPQNEPVEQWYGLEPPVGSGKTFTKAALLLRFLFTSSSSPDAAAAAAAAATAGGAGKGDSAAPAGSQRQSVAALAQAEDGVAGVGGSRAGSPGGGDGAGKAGLGAGNENFRQALLMAGVTPEGAGGGGSNADSAGVRRTDFPGRGGAKRGDDFSVDSSIDPFGADEIEGDEYLGGGGGDSDAARAAQRGELSLLHSQQQLQLGSWGGSNVGTAVLPGTTAAEAALALSTDEVLPAGLVDYFLVVGPAANEEGKLKVADYADCGFGSSGATAGGGGGSGPGVDELPATSVEVESAVLEHFPEEQREDAPFPTKVEWFCFPQGLFLRSAASQPAPHVSSFVRFTSGVRSYGLCLTFYRPADVLEETNPFVAESAPRGNEAGKGGGQSADGTGGGGKQASPPGQRRRRLWCPICLCVLTHIPVLEGLMHWLRMFHWCMVRQEKGSRGKRGSRRRPTELDAAVFQLTLELTGAADRAVLKTEMSISTAEFDTYRFCGTEDEEVELVFSLKEIKALLHFSETTEAQTLEMLFREGGDPLLFQSHSKAFAAELIMATMEPKVIRKEPPPPTAAAAGGAKREPGTAAGSGGGGYPHQGDQSQESDARWREGDPGYRDGGGGRGGGASQDSEATRTPASHDQGFDHNPFGEQLPATTGEGFTDRSASPSRRRGRVRDRLDGDEGEQQQRKDGESYEDDQGGGNGGGDGYRDGGYEEERQARLGDGRSNGRRRGASSDHDGTREQYGDPGWEQEEQGVEGGGVGGPEVAEDDAQQRDSELPTQFPGVRGAFESELPTQFPGVGNDDDDGGPGGGGGGSGKARGGGGREVDEEEEEEEDGGPVQGSKRRRRVVNEEEEA